MSQPPDLPSRSTFEATAEERLVSPRPAGGSVLTLSSRHLPGATLVTADGEVDATTSAELKILLDRERRSPDDHLIIDATRLTFLDCSGLSVLIGAAHACARGAALHLAGPQPIVARLVEITDARESMRVHDHVEQTIAAVRALNRESPR